MLYQGLLLGLSFSVITGPLMLSIIQASLERGFRAGISVASGIWFSDVLYILLVWRGITAIEWVTAFPGFKFWSGLAGGAMLIGFGLNNLLSSKKPPVSEAPSPGDRLLDALDGPEAPGAPPNWTHWGYAGYWVRGFLINTVNPFTVFFWIGIATGVVLPNQRTGEDTLLFFGGMMGALIVMATLKAYAAKRVRRFLTAEHTRLIRRIIGVVLIGFGIVLAARVW